MRTINRYIVLMLVATITMAACTSSVYEQVQEGHQLITFPVVLNGQPLEAGTGVEVTPPTCLHVWAILNMKADEQPQPSTYLFHRRLDDGTWDGVRTEVAVGTDTIISTLSMQVRLDIGAYRRFRIPVGEYVAPDGTFTVGYVYAMASKFDVDPFLPAAMKDSLQLVPGGMEQALRMMEDMTLDLTRLEATMASGEAEKGMPQGQMGFNQYISNLYSSPTALRLQSAQVISNSDNFYVLESAPCLQLVPCASLVQFFWDLDEDKHNPVNSIMLHDLPSCLRLFAPKDNPQDSTYQCLLLSNTLTEGVNTLSPDSRYHGRTSAFVLQPASGSIPYTLRLVDGCTYTGTASRTLNNRYVIKVEEETDRKTSGAQK